MIYIIGSLRNPLVPVVGNKLREVGFDAFDDWYGAGPEADDCWQRYEQQRGRPYERALYGAAAQNVYQFDKRHLDRCDGAVLIMPAGKSAHLELGYVIGQKKPGYVLFDKEPERWDVMYQFADAVFYDPDKLVEYLRGRRALKLQRAV